MRERRNDSGRLLAVFVNASDFRSIEKQLSIHHDTARAVQLPASLFSFQDLREHHLLGSIGTYTNKC
jgi:hypothetical protein